MPQHDQNIANANGATVRSDINSALVAIFSNSSGATAPSTTVAYQFWADTTSGLLKMRNAANSAWIDIGIMASTNLGLLPLTGGTLTGVLNTAQGSDIASASTINLDTATGNIVDVTGTTTITAVTLSQGRTRIVRFTGALTLTHGASLVLPTSANITTAAGDYAVFAGYASSVVRCVGYFRANGTAVGGGQVKIVTTTRDSATASGTQSVTGAGFTPRGVRALMTNSAEAGRYSYGIFDGTVQSCLYRNVATGNFGISNSYTIVAQDAAGSTQYLGSISLTSDGCDIAWTRVGTPTGVMAINLEFYR